MELIGLLATRCFCVVQKQKGVADAVIKARVGLDQGIGHLVSMRPQKIERLNPNRG